MFSKAFYIEDLFRSASGLFTYVVKVVNDFGIEKKFVGQTYDGAAVMAGKKKCDYQVSV